MFKSILCKLGLHDYVEVSPRMDARYLECKCCGKPYAMC